MSYPPTGKTDGYIDKISNYVESLDTKARQRYSEKLSCVGLSMADDPYLSINHKKICQ